MKVKTSDIDGAALDWAVANAAEVWKTAHELFPTWTMDATFSGVRPMVYSDGQAFCQLIPNNPMRQDAQRYSPSTDWSQGGPLIERFDVAIDSPRQTNKSHWQSQCWDRHAFEIGPTPLVAACRAIVASNLGGEVEIPDELLQ